MENIEWGEIKIGENEERYIEETKNHTNTTRKIWTKQDFDDKIEELHAQIEEIQERIEVLQEQYERFI